MDASAGARLTPPAPHQDTEIGRLARDINILADRLVTALHDEQISRLRSERDERKFHARFDNAEAGIIVVDHLGRLDSSNAAYLQLVTQTGAETRNTPPDLNQLAWREPAQVHLPALHVN